MEISFSFMPGVTPTLPLTPYEVEENGSITYTRYTDGLKQLYRLDNVPYGEPKKQKQIIIRKTVDGNITRMEKTFDFWENRASAKYIPINSSFNGVNSFQ